MSTLSGWLGYLHVKIGIQGVVGPISATEEVAEAGGRIGMKNQKMNISE